MEKITCTNCGESWDENTMGYEDAVETIKFYSDLYFSFCPACEHEVNEYLITKIIDVFYTTPSNPAG